jgi:folate-binding Fe-S cluster repair protein YgfZ
MTTTVYCELARLELIRFSGAEAQSFLHNQLTCDVTALAPGKSTYGSYCNPKGRMLATFLLWHTGDAFFMQLPSALREPIQKQISKYILRAKVKATDDSSEWMLFGVAGDGSESVVRRVVGAVPSALHSVAQAPGAMVIKLPGERYEIVAAKEKAQAVRESLASGTEKSNPDYWDWLDIHAGFPTILPATQEAFVPQMVNLDLIGGVSLTRGAIPARRSSRACITAARSSSVCTWRTLPEATHPSLATSSTAPVSANRPAALSSTPRARRREDTTCWR